MSGKPKIKEATLITLARLYMIGVYSLVPLPLVMKQFVNVEDTFINGYYFPVMAIFLAQGGSVFTYLFGSNNRNNEHEKKV